MLESSGRIPKFVRGVRKANFRTCDPNLHETFRRPVYPRDVGDPSETTTFINSARAFGSTVGSSRNAVLPTWEVPRASKQQAATVTNFSHAAAVASFAPHRQRHFPSES